jgi:hypothetical protein
MSQETSQWLNTRTLIGFTDKRGNAWHYRADEQGTEPNHYPLAIPTEDVRRRLFAWTHAEGDVSATYLGANGFETISDPDRKSARDEDSCRILSQPVRNDRRPMAGGRPVVR